MMSQKTSNIISGLVKPGFEAVREAFAENFTRRNELGGGLLFILSGRESG
jgi:hypothetical protein